MDRKKLARLHRVRTVQLNLAHAEESTARAQVASEAALAQRIASLAAAVAPSPAQGTAVSFAAQAHYREKLHRTAQAADNRVRTAEAAAARAAEVTQSAKRDQTAVDKLIARADLELALRELRALQEAPPLRKVRHDPC
jgi:flagellar FliJ protein